MSLFIDTLMEYHPFSDQEVNLIVNAWQEGHLKKGEYFVRKGEYSRHIGFIQSGITRVYAEQEDGREASLYFHSRGDFTAGIESLQGRQAFSKNIQAITDCNMLLLPWESHLKLKTQISSWGSLVETAYSKALLAKLQKREDLVFMDARTRYLEFIHKHGKLAYEIPLGYVASYLGIAQQSLSRIRKDLLHKGA